ncbi:MAG TPA: heavy metal sensor histidine kinase [Terriglobia bacterium]|nr:heavy metal sensor histidine kinase [Terriglobia bacterium]
MKPLGITRKLTLLFATLFTVMLGGLYTATYYLLANELEKTLNNELMERAAGLKGYIDFEDEKPLLMYDSSDSEESLFVSTATRYYQIYDLRTGDLVQQSQELSLLGLEFSHDEISQLVGGPPMMDVQTDHGPLRLYNDHILSPSGAAYLLQVGMSLESKQVTLDRFIRLTFWLIPFGLVVAGTSGWFMARRVLKPVQSISQAARLIKLSQLSQRIPLSGNGDEFDQLATTFNETFARLEHAVGEMKQFTGSIAHELRTPLTALRGEAEIALLHGRTAEDFSRVLSSQLEEFQKLTRLIDQLLTLARAEAGEFHIERVNVSIDPLLKYLVETLAPIAAEKGVSLDLESDPGIVVRGDKEWLERALLNLLDNAIKYTSAGGRVTVRASDDSTGVRLQIEDTGIGIPREALPRIFERFYRADPARNKTVEGVGLGLSLVKWIVEEHGGTIEATSHPGDGTRLTLHLPPD